MSVKYQVFVSSTYEDLKGERDQVVKAVLEMGHIPVGMEMFSAADEQQWQIISRHIESSDYYVVIVAQRYGSLEGDRSFTEKEYDYAIACGIPVLGFVIDDAAPWPGTKGEKDQARREALARFKDKVRSRYISSWSSTADLYGKVSIALTKQMTVQPRTGWVRADQAAGPQVLGELTRLSKENSELRAQLAAATRDGGRGAVDAWKEFIDRVYDYAQAKARMREVQNRHGSDRVAAEESLVLKSMELDKAQTRLEIEFRGSDQDAMLGRAYQLLDRIDKNQAGLQVVMHDIMGFARSIGATLRTAAKSEPGGSAS